MRPPVCAICNKKLEEKEGGLLSFALTVSQVSENKRAAENGFIGHPEGLEWFCGKHYDKAKQLTSLPLREAIALIRNSESDKNE